MKITVVLEPTEEGGFTALVPALPGCLTHGRTEEEALANIREALEVYIETLEDDLEVTPGSIVKKIDV